MIRSGKPAGTALALGLVAALGLLLSVGCGGGDSSEPDDPESTQSTSSSLSKMARDGEELFDANCSACHGMRAAGTNQGPTLIDRIYHPGHHSDVSIRNAVDRGVQQHHWTFGDMAPVAGVSPDDVEKIICYVRELQRSDGIFEGDDFQTVC